MTRSAVEPPHEAEPHKGAIDPVGLCAARMAALARRPDPDLLAVIAVPAPTVPLEALLGNAGGDGWLWDPPRGPAMCGIGAAEVIQGRGDGRFEQVAERAAELWARVRVSTGSEIDPPPPRLFGGFAFAPGSADAPPWSGGDPDDGFGDARFVLPRIAYGHGPTGAWLALAVTGAELADPRRRDRALGELAAVTARAAAWSPPPLPPVIAIDDLESARWRGQVDAIRAAIAEKRCLKVVAARARTVTCADDIDLPALLGRLARRYPDCYRFTIRRGPANFVGATPERLIARHGDQVVTEALAGTIAPASASPADQARAAARLLASRKDRGEQELVVRAIAEALGPWCDPLEVAATPTIRTLPRLLHLETPIRGRLRRPRHLLSLAAALHPTPAVGGTPTRLALDWITAHEPTPRGWYAGPVGWFDREGDGELAVALRSGLVSGDTARLYAGAGIVADSDPDGEYAETDHKLDALLGALRGEQRERAAKRAGAGA